VLETELGRGATGVVWVATDDVLKRTVAVKVLRPTLADDPRFLDLLMRHAGAAAGVSGAGLARLLDSGAERGVSFLVREHAAGESLRDILLREGRLEPDEAVHVVVQVLEGLSAAHAAGVLHLDITPENVIRSSSGEARLTDLGIGAAVSAAYPPTEAVAVLGVAAPAPEQADGRTLDARTDVFLAAALLFELLTGQPPTAEGSSDQLDTVAAPELVNAVRRALASDPDGRYADADAFAQAIRPSLERADQQPKHEGDRGGLRAWLVVPAAVAVVAGIAVSAGLWLGRLELGGPLGLRATDPSPSPSRPTMSRIVVLPIAGASAHDPFGDGAENDGSVPFAFDGDVSTSWRSENYFDPTMNNKPGVGILFDLGTTHTVAGFRLETAYPGYGFGLAVGDDPNGLVSSVSTSFTAEASMRAAIGPTQGRYVLLWATSVVDTDDGDRAVVGEFEVLGR